MTHHPEGQHDLGSGENRGTADEATGSGSTLGIGKAWSRAAVVAGASVLVSIVVLTIILGPPSPEGAGRVTGRFVPSYVITSVIATIRPRHRSWGRIIILFFGVFVGMLLLPVLGSAVDPIRT